MASTTPAAPAVELSEISLQQKSIPDSEPLDSTEERIKVQPLKKKPTKSKNPKALVDKQKRTLKGISQAFFGGVLCCFGQSNNQKPLNPAQAQKLESARNKEITKEIQKAYERENPSPNTHTTHVFTAHNVTFSKSTNSAVSNKSSEQTSADQKPVAVQELITQVSTSSTPSPVSNQRKIKRPRNPMPQVENYAPKSLLPEQPPQLKGRKTLVLDLDETLVHSSFKLVPNADFIVPVEITRPEGTIVQNVFVCKRPGVEEFLEEVGKLFEVVVFTASVSKYADPVMDLLDTSRVVTSRLFRESCTPMQQTFVKDLSRMGRDLSQTLIIDNSPICYSFQPENAMAIRTWIDEPNDNQLQELLVWLRKIAQESDVYSSLEEFRSYYGGDYAFS